MRWNKSRGSTDIKRANRKQRWQSVTFSGKTVSVASLRQCDLLLPLKTHTSKRWACDVDAVRRFGQFHWSITANASHRNNRCRTILFQIRTVIINSRSALCPSLFEQGQTSSWLVVDMATGLDVGYEVIIRSHFLFTRNIRKKRLAWGELLQLRRLDTDQFSI